MSTSLVSVIVPTYRRANRINQAVDSILNQSHGIENIQVIVVNDNIPGSAELAATDAKLGRYRHLANFKTLHTDGAVGGGAARNFACRQAAGDYLAFLDDDDQFLPSKIESQLEFMEKHKLDMSWQDVSWYDERGKLVEHRRLNHCHDFSRDGLLRAHLLTPISPSSIYMLKKSLFDKTDGFGEVPTGQDWWLMLRCIEADANIGYMAGVHVRQLLHDGERLSLGKNKLEGERLRHDKVREYYPVLPEKDIRYIEFRHNAVLAVSCKRSRKYIDCVKYGLRAIAASPRACISRGLDFLVNGKR